MNSVKNTNALQSVLKGLEVAKEQAEKVKNAEKAEELHAKIVNLLNSTTDMTVEK